MPSIHTSRKTNSVGFMGQGREGGSKPFIEVSQLEEGGYDGHDVVDLAFILPTPQRETSR